jgi:hypothetical protein
MAGIVISQVSEVKDPKIRPIVLRVVRELELTAEKVACNHADPSRWPLPDDKNSTEAIFAARFAELPAAIKQSAATKSMARMVVARPALEKRFGDLSNVILTTRVPIERQVRDLPFPIDLKLPPDYIEKLLHPPPPPAPPPTPAISKLEFRLHSVKCVDETDGFLGSEAGSDEISIAGTTVDQGNVAKIPVLKVGSFGSDGSVKTFSPPRPFGTFDLRNAPAFPSSYHVTLVLAEVDMGGLPDFVNKVLEKIRDKLASELAAAGAKGAGPLGAVLGAVIGFAVSEAFRIFKSTWEDDVFKPVTLDATIPTRNHRFDNGATDSGEGIAFFIGHGGRYEVTWDWNVLI